MNRRRFLQRTRLLSGGLALALPGTARERDSNPRSWRTFEVTTEIEMLKPSGVTRVWVPVTLPHETPFQRTLTSTLHCRTGTASIVKSARGLHLISAEFQPGAKPALTFTTRVKTRNWAVDFIKPGNPGKETQSELNAWLQPTRMSPTNGIVKQRVTEITKAANTDVDKARAIYDWIVEYVSQSQNSRLWHRRCSVHVGVGRPRR
jgi:hypothetical protein